MSKSVLKVENISKQYRLGQVGTGTVSHDFNRWWHKIRGKEDPYLKIGEFNDRTVKGDSDYVWALKDINFDVKQGEVLGIIGRNGAGKSTLLKILSRTTAPTTGSVKIKGRVASLLEVGTGFHPELSGKDNIFLNGAILGMSRREIQSKFDEIIDFAGVERYIDTPVKRYSSGMYVRLAFAVAAHLEPEILIVDEVLAVGDAEFQKKCLGKMKEVSLNQGRTVLFVSHNMKAIQNLCPKSVYMSNGYINLIGKSTDIINEYENKTFGNDILLHSKKIISNDGKIELIQVEYKSNNVRGQFLIDEKSILLFSILSKENQSGIAFEVFVYDNSGALVFTDYTEQYDLNEASYEIACILPAYFFNAQTYTYTVGISRNYQEFIVKCEEILIITFQEPIYGEGYQGVHPGIVRPQLKWEIENKYL